MAIDVTTIIVGVISAVGGGSFGAIGVKLLDNRANKETRQSDEFTKFRLELRQDYKDLKEATDKKERELTEENRRIKEEAENREKALREEQKVERDTWRREKAALEKRMEALETKHEKQGIELFDLRLSFASFRERVKLYINYVRSNNPFADDLAETLLADEHDVDRILEKKRRRMERRREKGPRVLLVDDDDDLLAVYSLLLRGEGYEVTTATNGVDGLRLCEEADLEGDNFDLVVLDFNMPHLNGEEAVRILRGLGDQETKVAIFTAHGRELLPELKHLRDNLHIPIWLKGMTNAVFLEHVKEAISV